MGSFLKKASFGLALPFVLLSLMAAQTPTTTTLAISPANYVALRYGCDVDGNRHEPRTD
jgi:hypothetical protein